MLIISGNCHGLGNPQTVQEPYDLGRRFKPKIVFLMEFKVGRDKVERVKRQIQFDGLFFVEGITMVVE